MKFRTGKYAGFELHEVKKRDPRYVEWVRENRPEMLREHRIKPKQIKPISRGDYVYIDPPDIPRADYVPCATLDEAFGPD